MNDDGLPWIGDEPQRVDDGEDVELRPVDDDAVRAIAAKLGITTGQVRAAIERLREQRRRKG